MTTSPTQPGSVFNPQDVQRAEQSHQAAQASALNARQMTGKDTLRQRAAELRHAADQLDRLAGALPEQMTAEQDYALTYFLRSTNVAV